MKKTITYLMFVLIILGTVLTGCENSNDAFIKEVNSNINVLGVKLNMKEDQVKTLVGAQVTKEPCVSGYEFNYEDKFVNIGFKNEEGTVRRITTKNADTSIYGIKPGTTLEDAFAKVKEAGFANDSNSKYKFHKNNIILTVLSMKETNADGVTLELDPEQK